VQANKPETYCKETRTFTIGLDISSEAQCQKVEFCLSILDSVEQNQEPFVPGL
jgi:hypothetical protein